MNVARARRAHGRPWVLLQRGAGGHGEPRGAGEVGGRLSSAAGGVHNARTQLLARSPGAGERPGLLHAAVNVFIQTLEFQGLDLSAHLCRGY